MADIVFTIFEKIASILEAEKASGDLTFVKNIFKGSPMEIPIGGRPSITIEPEQDNESTISGAKPIRVRKATRFLVVCEIVDIGLPEQIIGRTAADPGILKFVADVKNSLSRAGDIDLDLATEGVLNVRFPTTDYFISEEEYPVRGASITVEVDATVTKTGR